jgi:probable rRNA maturation factor
MEVEVSDTQGHLAVTPEEVAGLVRRVLQGEGVRQASISVALVDEATIHAVNRRHLAHDWPTDAISFLLSDPGEPVLCGELVLSAERAAAVARREGTDPWAELALYLVHGLLHLCGFDDLADPDVAAMRQREREILSREGLTYPFPLAGGSAAAPGGLEKTRWSE